MLFDKESIANFIFDIIKYDKVCKNDLEFSFEIFKKLEEYEKCSVINELLELKYYDNRKRNNNQSILNVEKIIESIPSGEFFFNKKDRDKIIKVKHEIEIFYNTKKEKNVIIPPFKNKNNIKYFINENRINI